MSNKFEEYFNSDEYKDLARRMEEGRLRYEKETDEWWEALSYEDKQRAFYSVVKRIVQAELKDRGTYRWALYDVFKFGPDTYGLGMDCGFMDLHNSIYTSEEIEAMKRDETK